MGFLHSSLHVNGLPIGLFNALLTAWITTFPVSFLCAREGAQTLRLKQSRVYSVPSGVRDTRRVLLQIYIRSIEGKSAWGEQHTLVLLAECA